MRVSAIVLAAGRSHRMGESKLALPFRGNTVLGIVLSSLARPGIEECIVVLGHHRESIEPILDKARRAGCSLVTTTNADPAGDMASSIREGVRASSSGADWLLITPGDLPLLQGQSVDQLLAEAASVSHLKRPPVLVPTCSGRGGHPVAVPETLRADILASPPGWSLYDLVHSPSYPVREVDVQDEGIYRDLDVPEDLKGLE